ncbi:XRE family transcriptional regulator [Thomasclavelia cocleata]|uniref:DNA-binding transcriptional regulator, XRE-family HTH domain n=1 Tax=Thomasclavelia cocleata TaxID=69824 RepID=A0A1I0BL82_9FIRM|nr:helix-turn-helix transcriptional regulator [Thomasclavelia cocleata]MCR1960192.1 helix-turn-helix transcriptional regulator [Thomasclavelia cocleata]NDO41834.1 helix-turn-helix transcriptional regulator [Thomasclavelia cocleata]PJN79908.1 XRE family transcriptional regulator [Thomasclavelia cocleata]SET07760.1 DNA-binding transcriptional regulator, XRE-family HTH domain [Thomasclavelia cocleata]
MEDSENKNELNIYKILRNCYGYTVNDVAERLDVTQQHVNAIERGAKQPSDSLIKKMCDLYKIDEATLCYFLNTTNKRRYNYQQLMLKILMKICRNKDHATI